MRTHSNTKGSLPARLARNALLGALLSCLLVGGTSRASQSVSVAWDAAAGATGYYFYSGTNSGAYTYQLDAGTNTAITLTGLKEGQTNYFKVAGYNAARMLGAPSSELSFIVPGCIHFNAATMPGGPASLSFPVAVGHSYSVQASTNLQSWATIWQTSTSISNAWVSYQDPQASNFSSRFSRLIIN
jgi:hypothetical protein